MDDPYLLTGDTASAPTPPSAAARPGLLPGLLWLVLAVSAVGNSVGSLAGAPTAANLAFGSVTVLSGAALVALRLRSRR
ncbi:hypothetical protein [Streptomyces sp. NPDC127098]|uniref:hypothetical protein n=1 Tax=Streptomyces sp. NPDC127098 TaxID=3347137 RepID=UPI0036692F96